jgi:4-hydroxyphenylacetate 3-monooxygenase
MTDDGRRILASRPRMITTIRELAGGGVLMLPSSVDDFANPEIARLIAQTQHGAIGSGMDRVKRS